VPTTRGTLAETNLIPQVATFSRISMLAPVETQASGETLSFLSLFGYGEPTTFSDSQWVEDVAKHGCVFFPAQTGAT